MVTRAGPRPGRVVVPWADDPCSVRFFGPGVRRSLDEVRTAARAGVDSERALDASSESEATLVMKRFGAFRDHGARHGAGRPFAPGALAHVDDEATTFHPLRAAPIDVPAPVPPTPPVAPPADSLLAGWRSASLPRRITIVLLPVAIAAVAGLFLSESESPLATEVHAAHVPGHAVPDEGLGTERRSPPRALPAGPATKREDGALRSPRAPRSVDLESGRGHREQGGAQGLRPNRADRSSLPAASPREPTLERRAADAVATGDDETALGHFEELAREFPDETAFADAVRILRERTRIDRPHGR